MKYVLILSFIFISCNTRMHKPTDVKFDKQGHRGCRALMPENTIPAMLTAIDLGVNTLELDVVITKDKNVILSHEPFFNHEISTKPNGSYVREEEEKLLNIYNMTYEETTQFDVGMKPHPRFPKQKKIKVSKPLLTDLIDSIDSYCNLRKLPFPTFNIETKCSPETDNVFHPGPKEFVHLLMKVIEDKAVSQRTIIQSFDRRTLQVLHKEFPEIRIALLVDEGDVLNFDDQIKTLGFTPHIYSPHFSLVTNDLLLTCRRKNILLIPWTVNNKDQIIELQKAGVNGLITDDPSLFN